MSEIAENPSAFGYGNIPLRPAKNHHQKTPGVTVRRHYVGLREGKVISELARKAVAKTDPNAAQSWDQR